MAKVKVFTVNGLGYLGTREENVITGIETGRSVVDTEVAATYLKTKQLKELVQVEVSGNSDVMVRELNRRETLDYKSTKAEFKEAKAVADDQLVNMVFDDIRKK